jgi:hypothetical protein
MPHSPLLPFNFTYNDCFGVPLIPITFLHKDGTRAQLLNNAILDSGANQITIPKALADMLGLKLQPRARPAQTAAGESQAFTATVNFNLGRGGRDVKYTDIEICVMEKCPAILIGIRPIFEDHKVTIMAYKKTCALEPKDQ